MQQRIIHAFSSTRKALEVWNTDLRVVLPLRNLFSVDKTSLQLQVTRCSIVLVYTCHTNPVQRAAIVQHCLEKALF